MGAPTTDVDTARNGYSLALDSKGQPALAWTASVPAFSGHPKVYVGVWTGSSWNTQFPPLDAITDSGTDPSLPSVALDASDRPVVAWRENTGNLPTYDAYVARWNGTDWTPLTGTGFMGGSGFSQLLDGPKLALDAKGNPWFGWLESGVGSGVASWSGTTWVRGQALIGGFTPYPVIDATGVPWIAAKSTDLHVLEVEQLDVELAGGSPFATDDERVLERSAPCAPDPTELPSPPGWTRATAFGSAWPAGRGRRGTIDSASSTPARILRTTSSRSWPSTRKEASGSPGRRGPAAQVWMSNY